MAYLTPRSVDEALDLLRQHRPVIVAGCTDVLPAQRQGQRPAAVLDLSELPALQGISHGPEGWRIGAATTWTEIARAALPPAMAGLQQAARQVGAIQIQNAGTIGGNICNASPAADGVPPLLTLNAEIEVASVAGLRRVPLSRFITGPRRIDLAPDEIVTAVVIPQDDGAAGGAFLKLGARSFMVISIAMVAAVLRVSAGRIVMARVAVGSCSAVAQRLTDFESDLEGRSLSDLAALLPDPARHFAPLAPISDVRATAAYRTCAAQELCRRALLQAASVAEAEENRPDAR